MKYTADFESTTKIDDCRIWAYGICRIDTLEFAYGNNLDDFMQWCKENENPIIYFHNLKFDGSFILTWLLENNYQWIKDESGDQKDTFSTLIDGTGKFYQITVYFRKKSKHVRKVTFLNSLNILPFSVSKIAKAFGLPIKKGSIDYDAERPIGHILTEDEIDYLKNDCEIVARALMTLFNHDPPLTAMTQAGNGMLHLKTLMGKKKFRRLFPVLDEDGEPYIDNEIRQSYKGGFCYLLPQYSEKELTSGMVLDVNSLYPWVMKSCLLPYGTPTPFRGKYEYDPQRPLFIQMIRCQFDLKAGFLPTIQLKNSGRFAANEYLTTNEDEDVVMCLTSVDLELFTTHYNVYDIDYLGGYKFKATDGLFAEYVDKWTKEKTQAKIDGNDGMYTLAKLMQNAVYGRFALNPKVSSKKPYLDSEGILHLKQLDYEYREALYIPVATFITAWARHTTITAGQANYKRAIYFDTDSLHLIGTEPPIGIKVHDTELGAWKHEFTFDRAIYLRQKAYILHGIDTSKPDKTFTKMACAGMPYKVRECADIRENPDGTFNTVDFDNFKFGSVFQGGLKPKRVKGGTVLVNTPWQLKK